MNVDVGKNKMDRRDCLKRFAWLGACSGVLSPLASGMEKNIALF